jgi:adenine deaminase
MRNIQHKLSVARGEQRADLVFTNARVVNVFSGEIHKTNVAVEDGRVIGFGDYRAKTTIDLDGAYLAPSLIDGHFHVESSMLTASEFVRAVVPHGTGAVVIGPHEYANVLGLDGIRYVPNLRRISLWTFSSCCQAAFPLRIWKPPAQSSPPTI